MTPSHSTKSIVDQLRTLGVRRGGILVVHVSYRAVRPVEGGPTGLIDALLSAAGPEGTVVMPSWTGNDDGAFDPRTTPADTELGVVAETFRRRPDAVRSPHPFAFAAIGPAAKEIVDGFLPLPPHGPDSPIGRVHDRGGQVLLLGVDHDANTTIHLAEVMAGVPYRVERHITVVQDGVPQRLTYGENDHCCARFRQVGPWLQDRGLQRSGPVGSATACLADARDIVAVTVARLRDDPLTFLHPPDAGCEDCDNARASIPV